MLLDVSWFEAAHLGGVKPMQMVAQCLANRARGGFGSWSQVLSTVYQPGRHPLEMSILSDRLLAKNVPDTADPRFGLMLPAIDRIYENTGEDLVKGGVFWADLASGITRQFGQEIIFDKVNHHRTAQLGTFCVWD